MKNLQTHAIKSKLEIKIGLNTFDNHIMNSNLPFSFKKVYNQSILPVPTYKFLKDKKRTKRNGEKNVMYNVVRERKHHELGNRKVGTYLNNKE